MALRRMQSRGLLMNKNIAKDLYEYDKVNKMIQKTKSWRINNVNRK